MSLTQSCLGRLRACGRSWLIFTGSVTDGLGGAHLGAYVASTAALAGLTRLLAHELKDTGTTVNCLAPGAVRVEKEEAAPESDQLIVSWQAVGRRLTAVDVLGLVRLLLSEADAALTGQTITVDGGLIHPIADPKVQEFCLFDPVSTVASRLKPRLL